ncbi:thioredoxin family protein [Silvibacterium dinghuense]|uniref:Thioredoxin family protein n=1 Tax=Silvibacterium dinghuense TaxID=1560006 RepID=A0A4Q1SJD9_9BACT|nr:thioredoxin family protein [Silvibacterium dinghuense]RXS97547.1 thioredoxin family protein [Silvibacterium dinghuense]GGG99919.1 thioredoxin family protein [Silvibacterium dinghuense]
MARTESAMVELGTSMPNFTLRDVATGAEVSNLDVTGTKGTLVMFICRHCPFVKHLQTGLAQFGKDYDGQGISIVAISSNDAEKYPDDAPESLAEQAKELGSAYTYLYDETQDVARSFDATCTPDFFLFNSKLALVYRGQFDGSRPGNEVPVTGSDLRAAMDALLAGKAIGSDQKPSLGCNIKWKS